MKSYIIISYNYVNHRFLLDPRPCQNINVDGAVHFRIFKHHSHRYELFCFFYGAKRIIGSLECKTKRELLHVIQNLLQEFLYFDGQNNSGA